MSKQQTGNIRRASEAAALWGARRAEIVRLYETEMWPQQRLADHYGVTLAGMQRAMARLGIASRSRANHGPRNGRFRDGKASTIYRDMITKGACRQCDATTNLCVHHKDGVHTNNAPENLEVMCMSCHSRMHKSEWWRSRKAGRSAQTPLTE